MSTVRLEYLKNQLKHPLPTIRYNAVRSMGELNSSEVIEYLVDVAQNDMSEGVRHAAEIVLAELGSDQQGYARTS